MTANIVTRQRAAINRLTDENQIARDALEVIAFAEALQQSGDGIRRYDALERNITQALLEVSGGVALIENGVTQPQGEPDA